MPDVLTVSSLKIADAQSSMEMIDRLHENDRWATGYLLADATYDTNLLHEHAARHSFQLLTPRKRPGTALGHCPHSSARLRSIELLESDRPFGKQFYALREQIERDFGHLCSFGGGLQPLPSWVPRPRRVTRWIIAKLIISGLRYCKNHAHAA